MRKLLMALALSLLPMLGIATTGPAAAAAPGSMTLLDRLTTAPSSVDQVRYHRRLRCTNVCVRRSYRSGRCVRWTRRCYRAPHRYSPRRHYRRW